ncbi:hypothetical protein NDI85_21165 [Halomicroarcula sp. S1AR25-4]|uniref:hypothetical protein n=1 Tax=Haloarcula sp. S1AR25-4 TaxID=2950538 RepID=UPI002876EA40|nr:hypothetical protein [Halomicroarcula sp. S1AR25-4]MDS0280298.1 hypothetical protein [Halomicroarcula sp. S1AR25-4]
MVVDIPVPLAIAVELRTNPLGGRVTVTVVDAPAESAREAILDDIERKLVGEQENLVFQTVQRAHQQLQSYADRNGYTEGPLLDSFAGVDASRGRRSVQAEWSWDHKVMQFWEFGVAPHTIEGNPLLHFYWEAADQWVKTESVEWGSETGGIPPSRAVRDSLNWLRRELS